MPQDDQQKHSVSGIFQGNMLVIALSSAVRSLGSFVGVYLPKYFLQIGGNPLTLGLYTSLAYLIQFLTLSVGGFIADFHGRRRIIVVAAFYGVFFPLLYAFVQDWRVFGALTLFATIGTISNPAVHATVADSIAPERRTLGIASLQVVSSLPSVISPLLGGWLIANYGLENGFRTACLYAAVFAFLSALPLFVFLKETLHPKSGEKTDPSIRNVFSGFREMPSNAVPNSLRVLISCYALVAFANSAVAQYYILFASSVVGLSDFSWGIVVSLQLLVASVLKIPGGWFSDRFGKRKTMIASLLTTVPAILLFVLSRSFFEVVVAAVLLVAAGIYYAPAHEAFQADLTPRSVRGRITAMWDMGSAVSAALGAAAGGFAFQAFGPAVPFYVFAIAESVAALLLIGMVKEPETREP